MFLSTFAFGGNEASVLSNNLVCHCDLPRNLKSTAIGGGSFFRFAGHIYSKATNFVELIVGDLDSVTTHNAGQLYLSIKRSTFMVVSNASASPVAAPAGQPLPARLAKNIAVRRKALGLTQAQLAERLGVDTETLSRFERGKHLPSLLTLERLADLLLTTMAELLAEDQPKVDDEISMLSTWLTPLSPQDRDFARGMLKQCCDHLSSR
jgi:transcriptional regulator with XRE-family HTH domain